ncbi:hypothetical protein V5O48_015671 [Marasmius crinis-equi]|uniref:Exoribonuclease phosphorolytic domain-containing protein n=1 Tax=Marasmius crinis-equi TaxID=585013 RepID=A0ABR3ETV5_9AGAR
MTVSSPTFTLSFDTLSRVDGSARFGFGPSSQPQALASVSGPIEVRLLAEQASQATLEVTIRPISNVPATESKLLGGAVAGATEPSLVLGANPRTLVQVVVQMLQSLKGSDEGGGKAGKDGMVAAIVNATTLALLNAGSIPMRGVVCAVSVGLLDVDEGGEKTYIVNPDTTTTELIGSGCFAFLFSDFEPTSQNGATCVWSNWRRFGGGGGFDEEEILKTREIAREGAREVWRAVKKLVEETELRTGTGEIPLPQKKPMKISTKQEDDEDARMEI